MVVRPGRGSFVLDHSPDHLVGILFPSLPFVTKYPSSEYKDVSRLEALSIKVVWWGFVCNVVNPVSPPKVALYNVRETLKVRAYQGDELGS